jgi:MFS family permease
LDALAVLLLGFSLSVTDFFIVNVALPTMGRDLHAGDASLELVVSSYGLAYALLLVLGGRLGDSYGRRRLFTAGMAGFTVCSLLCGLAPNILALVCARVLQGAAAAMMVPQVLATFHASLDQHGRARAIGLYGATAGLSMIAGQALGGLIVAADIAGSGWRAIFLVNVPVGIAGLALLRRVPETRSENPAPIDRPGTALLTATLLCLMLPLTEGQSLGWPWWSWVCLGAAPLLAVAFARKELSLEARGLMPLVPPSLVRMRSVRRGICLALPFFVSFGGFMFVYAIVSQDGLHLRPFVAGLALIPYAVAFFVTSLQTPRLLRRFGNHLMAIGAGTQGVAFGGLALALLAEQRHPSWLVFGVLFIAIGAGQALLIAPVFRLILSEVPTHLAGKDTQQLRTRLWVQSCESGYGLDTAAPALAGLKWVGRSGSPGYASGEPSLPHSPRTGRAAGARRGSQHARRRSARARACCGRSGCGRAGRARRCRRAPRRSAANRPRSG